MRQDRAHWLSGATTVVRSCRSARVQGGGGGRIRTHGALRHSGFQDRRLKPLGHPSALQCSRLPRAPNRRSPGEALFEALRPASAVPCRKWREGPALPILLRMGTSKAPGTKGRTARLLCLAASLLCVAAAAPARDRPKPRPEVLHFTGRFVCFEATDYRWADFCVGDSLICLEVFDPWVSWFLAAHVGAQLDLEVRNDVADGAGVEDSVAVVSGASIDGYTSEAWRSDTVRSLGYQRAETLFGALEDSLTADYRPDCKQFRPGR